MYKLFLSTFIYFHYYFVSRKLQKGALIVLNLNSYKLTEAPKKYLLNTKLNPPQKNKKQITMLRNSLIICLIATICIIQNVQSFTLTSPLTSSPMRSATSVGDEKTSTSLGIYNSYGMYMYTRIGWLCFVLFCVLY